MFYRRVSILIPYNSENEVLLQHRTKDAPHYPDYWGFFGGDIDEGETPREAVIREAKEELGLSIKEIDLFKRYEIQEIERLYERFVFLFSTQIPIERLRSQQNEGTGLDFYQIEDIEKLKFNPHNKIIIREVALHLNNKK